jgi:hypothetical protein
LELPIALFTRKPNCPELVDEPNMTRTLFCGRGEVLRSLGLVAVHLALTLAAEVTNGPLAGVSIASEMAYSTARACAAGCLRDNGVYPCQVAGFYDLAAELACGRCSPINACYCSEALGSSATSYVSACVSRNCAKSIDSWPDEVTSMLAIYDGYCATANVAPTTTSFKTPAKTTATATAAGAGSGSETNPGAATATGAGATSAVTGAPSEAKGGLTQSDIVALAASLGVGIPSLAIAAITLCVQLRKRRARVVAASSEPKTHSMTNLQSSATPPPPPLYYDQGHGQPYGPYGAPQGPYGAVQQPESYELASQPRPHEISGYSR